MNFWQGKSKAALTFQFCQEGAVLQPAIHFIPMSSLACRLQRDSCIAADLKSFNRGKCFDTFEKRNACSASLENGSGG